MSRKRYTPEQIIGKLREAEVALAQGARVSYHARRWYVHVASAFPLSHHYRAVLAWGS